MILLIKTKQGDHHAFDDMKKAGDFICEYPGDIVFTRSYDSPIEFVHHEYMHNDLCMSELLRSISKEIKLDYEIIVAALCYAGEDDLTDELAMDILYPEGAV